MEGTRRWCVLWACAGLLAACAPDLPTEQRSASPDAGHPGEGTYAGRWSGLTGQGQVIRFAVSDEGLTRLELGWEIGGCSYDGTFTFDEPAPIEAGTVSSLLQLDDGRISAEVSITFASGSEAAGSLTFQVDSMPDAPACAGVGLTTFTATKS